MQSRSGVDGHQGTRRIVEWKGAPRAGSRIHPVWLAAFPPRGRWLHVIPLTLLLAIGLAVPGFFTTLVILLGCLTLALTIFVLLVQFPVGYLFHRWRDARGKQDSQPRNARRAPSSGL